MKVNPKTTAVLVVDIQNSFTHPEGSIYAPGAESVVDPINDLLEVADEAGAHIVFTRDVHTEDQFEDVNHYDEFERWGEHNLEGTWEAEIAEGARSDLADYVLDKHTYDCFHETGFDEWLEERGITTLLFVGGLANICLADSAGSAAMYDFHPVLLEDKIGTIQGDHKEQALERTEFLYGDVISSDELEFEE